MGIELALEAGAQLAKACQPYMHACVRSATQRWRPNCWLLCTAAPCNARLGASLAQRRATLSLVAALVCMEFGGAQGCRPSGHTRCRSRQRSHHTGAAPSPGQISVLLAALITSPAIDGLAAPMSTQGKTPKRRSSPAPSSPVHFLRRAAFRPTTTAGAVAV